MVTYWNTWINQNGCIIVVSALFFLFRFVVQMGARFVWTFVWYRARSGNRFYWLTWIFPCDRCPFIDKTPHELTRMTESSARIFRKYEHASRLSLPHILFFPLKIPHLFLIFFYWLFNLIQHGARKMRAHRTPFGISVSKESKPSVDDHNHFRDNLFRANNNTSDKHLKSMWHWKCVSAKRPTVLRGTIESCFWAMHRNAYNKLCHCVRAYPS